MDEIKKINLPEAELEEYLKPLYERRKKQGEKETLKIKLAYYLTKLAYMCVEFHCDISIYVYNLIWSFHSSQPSAKMFLSSCTMTPCLS